MTTAQYVMKSAAYVWDDVKYNTLRTLKRIGKRIMDAQQARANSYLKSMGYDIKGASK